MKSVNNHGIVNNPWSSLTDGGLYGVNNHRFFGEHMQPPIANRSHRAYAPSLSNCKCEILTD